jgi:hypothetical protein
MKTFLVKLRNGEQFHLQGAHLYYSDTFLRVVTWDQEVNDWRYIAVFPLVDVQYAFGQEYLTFQLSPERPTKKDTTPWYAISGLAIVLMALIGSLVLQLQ